MASRTTTLLGAIAAAGAVAWLVRMRASLRDALVSAAAASQAAAASHAQSIKVMRAHTELEKQLVRVRTALGRCQLTDVAIAEPPAAPNLVPTPSWSRCLAALAAGDEFYRSRRYAKGVNKNHPSNKLLLSRFSASGAAHSGTAHNKAAVDALLARHVAAVFLDLAAELASPNPSPSPSPS